MIEAPEAHLLCEQLSKIMCSKRVTDVFAQYTPHKFTWFYDKPKKCAERLVGKTIDKAYPQGGMVELTTRDTMLILTDGVNLRYFEPGAKLPSKHQLLVTFDGESCLLASVQVYGALLCFTRGHFGAPLAAYYKTTRAKPQMMSDAFDKEYFLGLVNVPNAQKKSAKIFLATEQTIPGLGNEVLQDILHHVHIHPKTRIDRLGAEGKEKMYEQMKETLQDIYRLGGRSTETDLFGVPGQYIASLSKNTAGRAHPEYGETIVGESYPGESIYYCRGCQVMK